MPPDRILGVRSAILDRASRLVAIVLVVLAGGISCSGESGGSEPTATPSLVASGTPAEGTTPSATASIATAAATAVPSPLATAPILQADEPHGFPLPPDVLTDIVQGVAGARTIVPAGGLSVRDVAERVQLLADPAAANASGWNCAVHVEYEGTPAIDWYVRPGTPVLATMDGTATLLINTTKNAFDYYGVDREPYIGDPDRARAPVSPFSGPGGGMGLYVSVTSGRYRADFGHLSLIETIANVPTTAFREGFSSSTDYAGRYATPRSVAAADVVASWPVRRGDVIGFTGDTGYSEAPHLHYQITRLADRARLCPGADGW